MIDLQDYEAGAATRITAMQNFLRKEYRITSRAMIAWSEVET